MVNENDPYYLFERHALASPAAPALRIAGRTYSYGELLGAAGRYARWCVQHTPAAARVAVFGRKTFEAYAAILGILRSGRSYVPLHPGHPPARWQTMLQRAGVTVGFCTAQDLHPLQRIEGVEWCADPGTGPEPGAVSTGHEAYVMFTSGSTGGPKGVAVGRSQVSHYLRHQLRTYDLGSADRFTQWFALTFDLSVHDLFVCWGCGACLCVPEDDGPLRAVSFVRDNDITVWFSVPSLAQVMRRMRWLKPGSLSSLRYSFFCGEALPYTVASDWARAAHASRIINLYGPTETTIAIAGHEFTPAEVADPVPLGTIFPDHLHLIDDRSGLTGEGELLISGPQVNAGYVNDEAATTRSFVLKNDRMWYRTGDRVKRDHHGVLLFLGRMDDQVKIQGHRVEPGEVDRVIAAHLNGGSSITLPVQQNDTLRLITFIDSDVDADHLFDLVRAQVPLYMVPERIVRVHRLPVTAHGKIDRDRLLKDLGSQ